MAKHELRGVQEGPLKTLHCSQMPRRKAFFTSIECVADDRMPDGAQMDTDLMGPPRFDGDAK